MIDVSDILQDADLGSTRFTRLRPTTTITVDGVAVNDYEAGVVELTGIVQPAATTDANMLPEGVRISDVHAFFTSGDVSTGSPGHLPDGNGSLPDVLVSDGVSYRVLHIQDFGRHGVRKVLAQRFEAGEAGY